MAWGAGGRPRSTPGGGSASLLRQSGDDVSALFVSTSESIHPDRDLGRRLAIHLGRLADPQPATIQALLADLLADDQAFLAPVRDLAGRAAFRSLVARRGSGGGQLERDALLQSLAPTYSEAVLSRLAAFLDGWLDLPPEQTLSPAPAIPATVQPAADLPALVTSQPLAPPPSGGRRWLRRLALVSIFGVTAGITATAVLVLRSGLLCSLSASLPFCGAASTATTAEGSSKSPDQAINTGLQAARDLATASDLSSFERALNQLESALLSVSGANLPAALLPQREGLDAIVRTARERLRQEESDRHTLELAREARDLALRQTDPKAMAAVEAAISQLQAISSGSFSETDARALLRDLEAARIRLVQTPPAGSTSAPPDPSGTPSPTTPPSPPSPGSGAPTNTGGGSGQRGEPLF